MKIGRLDKVNDVYGDTEDPAVVAFASEYIQGNRGDFRPGGPTARDEAHAEHFAERYATEPIRHGYAGSGTVQYTGPDGTFEVDRRANGRTFYGTDHTITKVGA